MSDAPLSDGAGEAAAMPESPAEVAVELVVQPAVQAKPPRTAAIARISRKMRDDRPAVGDALFMWMSLYW
jgi:hypothetical protein